MKYYAVKNPIGSIIRFIISYNETDVLLRKAMILEWFEHQSPNISESNKETVFEKYDSQFNFEIELIAQIFLDLGWLPYIVKPLFEEKFQLLKQNGFILYQNEKVVLSNLGKHLYDQQTYNQYIESISYKANFWKLNNVKITDNNSIGSGAFISKNEIITCRHVVDEFVQNEVIIEDESLKKYTIESIRRPDSENIDLAIIKTKENFDFFPYEIEEETYLVEKVIIFGYPPIPLTSKAFLIANLGEISAEVDNYIDGTDCLILSSITRPGNSGGPVLNEYGKLVGIMSQNRQYQITFTWENMNDFDVNKGLGYASAIKSKYVLELISQP